jgi:microcystin-dependent protein
MTIPVTEPFISGPYAGNGATLQFDYGFRIYEETELKVVRKNADDTLTVLARTTDYTVAGVNQDTGRQITLVAGDRLPAGATLTIEPDITLSQDRPFSDQTSTTLSEIENTVDKTTSMVRQLKGLFDRTPIAQPGNQVGEILIGNDSEILMWDANGNIVPGLDGDEIANAQTYAENAATSATNAATSATEAATSLAEFQASTASATTLAPGSSATASYDGNTNNFAFGVPRGDVGPTGPAGAMPGQTAMFAMNTAPTGWLKANGATISRITYSDLFAAIGTTFGAGDGSTTFQLPDLRGEFIRGWDDSRGADSGRGFATFQNHELYEHGHSIYVHHKPAGSNYNDRSGFSSNVRAYMGGVGSGGNHIDKTLVTTNVGSSETRPRNVALLACIKY